MTRRLIAALATLSSATSPTSRRALAAARPAAGRAGRVDGQQVLDLAIRMVVDPGWRTTGPVGGERQVER